jgi:uncharacterized protein (TIGR03435 family)
MRYAPILSLAFVVCAQTADEVTFEVASVKPADPLDGPLRSGVRIGCRGGPGTSDPVAWTCRYVNAASLILGAYNLNSYQTSLADWMRNTMFDVAAKVSAGATREQLRQMEQHLLEERFRLKVHREQKEMSIYELTVGKSGLKMTESAPDADLKQPEEGVVPRLTLNQERFPMFPPGQAGFLGLNGRYHWLASNVTTAQIVEKLRGVLNAEVVDATHLTGKYNIDIMWLQGSLNPVSDIDDGPSLQRALQEKLGLKLDSKKGRVEVLVIDHMEKTPTGN